MPKYVRLDSVKRCNADASLNVLGSYCIVKFMSDVFNGYPSAIWHVKTYNIDDSEETTIDITSKIKTDSIEPNKKYAVFELSNDRSYELQLVFIESFTLTSNTKYLPKAYADNTDAQNNKTLVVDLKTRFCMDTNITYRNNLLNNSDFSNCIAQRGAPDITQIYSIALSYASVSVGSSSETATEWKRVYCTDSGADILISVAAPCQVYYRFEVEYINAVKKTTSAIGYTVHSNSTGTVQLRLRVRYALNSTNTTVNTSSITETYPPAFTSKHKYLIANIYVVGYEKNIAAVVCNSTTKVVSFSSADGPFYNFIDRWRVQPDVDDVTVGVEFGYIKLAANSTENPSRYAATMFDPSNTDVSISSGKSDSKVYLTVYAKYSDGSTPYKSNARYICSIPAGTNLGISGNVKYGVSVDKYVEPDVWDQNFPTLTSQNRYLWVKYIPNNPNIASVALQVGSYYKYARAFVYAAGYVEVINGSLVQFVENFQDDKNYTLFAETLDGSILREQVDGVSYKLPTLPEGKWKWAALYEGDIQSDMMPRYIPKGYNQELLDCQRYLRVYDYNRLLDIGNVTGCMFGFIRNSGKNMYLMVTTDTPMRARPTVTISSNDEGSVTVSDGEHIIDRVEDFEAVAQTDVIGRVITIRLTKVDGTPWAPLDQQLGIIYFTPGTTIELSAEL